MNPHVKRASTIAMHTTVSTTLLVPMCGLASVCAWYINTMFNTDAEINSVHVSGFINEIVAYSFLT